jgi:hypothetical protein
LTRLAVPAADRIVTTDARWPVVRVEVEVLRGTGYALTATSSVA